MKKIVSYILIFIIVFVTLGFCTACNTTSQQTPNHNEEPNVGPKTFTVEFGSMLGGRVEGNLCQTVNEGASSQKVIAIADMGYYFAGWADLEINSDQTVTQSERVVDNVRQDRYCYAMFERMTLQVEYVADENGEIQGELVQSGKYGDDASSITAIPNFGYRFVCWSDGVTEPTRSDQFIDNTIITAKFEVITNVYTYNYKYADSGCDAPTVSLTYGQLENTVFAVPQRTPGVFGGWYADKYLTQQVSDENGNIVIGNELFANDGTQLYAKWISQNTHKYKILMVYVTELNAELTTVDGKRTIQVNYSMSEVERQICHMITEKISFELNDLAVADFQVDEYFTTVPLTKESIQQKPISNSKIDYKVYAYDIPEVRELIDLYDSVLVSFSFDDYFGDLHSAAGEADRKFGSINFDGRFTQILYYNEPIENLLDPSHYYWEAMLRTYLHEFAHTIELCVNNIFDFHTVIGEYIWETARDSIINEKLYFLNKASVDGEIVGVPYEFWEGKIATVHYEAQRGGYVRYVGTYHSPIYGQSMYDDVQRVILGQDAITVKAMAFDDYEFVGWSDGIETDVRHDLNIVEDLHVYAIFREKE